MTLRHARPAIRRGARAPLLLAAILAISASSLSGEGGAVAGASSKPSEAARREAADRFDLGLKLFEGGDNAAALAEFKRAYDLVPNLVALYNIGLVYAAMTRPVEAVDALDQVLADGGTRLSVQQRRNAREVRDEQSSRVARVMVVTDRPATVEIDGVEAGRTPLAAPLRVPSGSHTISVVATGYLPSRRQLMFAGQITETLTLTLTPTETTSAHLTVSVPVPGAEILVNGKAVGVTPLPASIAVTPGRTEVQVRRAGYQTVVRTIALDEGANGALDVALEDDPNSRAPKGLLRLALNEPDAEIAIDGVIKPAGPGGVFDLPAGPHALRVRRAGFQTAERTVSIADRQETAITATLAPTLESRARGDEGTRTRRLVATIVVAGGGLIVTGAGVYLVATRNNLSNAQAQLGAQLARERDPAASCYNGTEPPPKVAGAYVALGCAEVKGSLADAVDQANLRRTVGFGAGGLGLVAAGVGTYLLLRAAGDSATGPTTSQLALWSDGRMGGLSIRGAF